MPGRLCIWPVIIAAGPTPSTSPAASTTPLPVASLLVMMALAVVTLSDNTLLEQVKLAPSVNCFISCIFAWACSGADAALQVESHGLDPLPWLMTGAVP